MVEEFAGPRDICQAVLTAIFTSGVLQQLFECPPQSLPDIRTKQRRKFKASGFRKQYHEGSTTSSHVMTPLVKCCSSTCSASCISVFSMKRLFCVYETPIFRNWYEADQNRRRSARTDDMNAPAGFDHKRRWDRTAVGEPVEWGLSAY